MNNNQEQDNFHALGPKPEFSTQPTEAQPEPQPMPQQPMYQQQPMPEPEPVEQPIRNVSDAPMYTIGEPMEQYPQTYESYDSQDYDDSPKKSNLKAILIAIGAIVVLGLIIFFVMGALNKNGKKEAPTVTSIFTGEGYSFKYPSTWTEGKNDEHKALKNKDNNATLMALGTSALDYDINCDFGDESCQSTVYNNFYEVWIKELSSESMSLFKNDYVFEDVANEIYIAYYNYGKSNKNLKGRYYVIVSKDMNAVATFVLNVDDDLDKTDKAVREMFNTITFDKIPPTDKITNETLKGDWLNVYGDYWKFTDNEFYWYKSKDVLDDNYWYGTYTYEVGEAGLGMFALDTEKLNKIVTQSEGTVKPENVYSITFTPKKIISGGEDKSSSNIPEGTVWKVVWILVDHGEDGWEAQTLNISTEAINYYYRDAE